MIPSPSSLFHQWLLKNPYRTGFYVLLAAYLWLPLKNTCFIPSTPVIIHDTQHMEPVATYLDEHQKLRAKIRQQNISLAQGKRSIDSLAHLLKVKPTHVKEVDRFIYQTDTILYPQPDMISLQKDTVCRLLHQDGWLTLEARIGHDSSCISIRHIDTLTRTAVEKRPLLKPPIQYVDISNTSPYSRITAGYTFKVTSPRPDLTIGPYIGYDPFLKQPSFGISIQKPILQLYLRKSRKGG